jgi:NitT/TauT family transport system ATP-binding protein
VPVTLPRPRDPASPEFNALKRELTGLVMEEQARHQADEAHATAD